MYMYTCLQQLYSNTRSSQYKAVRYWVRKYCITTCTCILQKYLGIVLRLPTTTPYEKRDIITKIPW